MKINTFEPITPKLKKGSLFLIRISIIGFLLTASNCKKEMLIKKNPNQIPENLGYLTIQFPSISKETSKQFYPMKEYGFGNSWDLTLFIDFDTFISNEYGEGSSLTILLPEGSHTINYSILYARKKPFLGKFSANSEFGLNSQKKLEFKIEPGQTTTLHIEPKTEMKFSILKSIFTFPIFPILFPLGYWPFFEQDVSLKQANPPVNPPDQMKD